jgi:hypothetical protein
MQDSVLETLLVVDYMIQIWTQNLLNFIVKFGSKAEICWKLEEWKWILLNNSKVLSYLLRHILLLWKFTMQPIEPFALNFFKLILHLEMHIKKSYYPLENIEFLALWYFLNKIREDGVGKSSYLRCQIYEKSIKLNDHSI